MVVQSNTRKRRRILNIRGYNGSGGSRQATSASRTPVYLIRSRVRQWSRGSCLRTGQPPLLRYLPLELYANPLGYTISPYGPHTLLRYTTLTGAPLTACLFWLPSPSCADVAKVRQFGLMAAATAANLTAGTVCCLSSRRQLPDNSKFEVSWSFCRSSSPSTMVVAPFDADDDAMLVVALPYSGWWL